jgi:hypothetical protein
MRRRLLLAVVVAGLGAATGVMGAHASGPIPAVCVTQPIRPTQLEVGYCPDGPTQPLVANPLG